MKNSINSITPVELQKLEKSGTVELIDVGTPAEFREIHAGIVSANQPIGSLDPRGVVGARKGSPDEPLYLICRSGNRSAIACEQFIAAGYDNAVNVEGGTVAWEAAGLAVTRGKKAVSLERQVRIFAGSLVLLGTILAWFIHPVFVFLSGFIGAGQVFAGVTDTCGVAMLLARMPWNHGRDASCSS
jgi:rhodanese-related sulfurtransferase